MYYSNSAQITSLQRNEQILEHFDDLLKSHQSGGLVGNLKISLVTLALWLQKQKKEFSTKKILVVGSSSEIQQFQNSFLGGATTKIADLNESFLCKNAGIVLAEQSDLMHYSILDSIFWDLLLIIHPEKLIQNQTSQIFQSLSGISYQFAIGLFQSHSFLEQNSQKIALSILFDYSETEQYTSWEKGLVIKGGFSITKKNRSYEPTEIIIDEDQEEVSGFSIPSERSIRTKKKNKNLDFEQHQKLQEQPETLDHWDTFWDDRFAVGTPVKLKSFKNKAEEYCNDVVETAKFFEYQSLWPSYDSLNSQQFQWFLYWRGKVKKGIFLETSTSYLFLFSYELLLNVGTKNPQESFLLLESLLQNYSEEQYQTFREQILVWMTDFIVFYELAEPDLISFFCENVIQHQFSIRYPNLFIEYAIYKKKKLPFWVLKSFLQIKKTRFYETHQEWIEKQFEDVFFFLLKQERDLFHRGKTQSVKHSAFEAAPILEEKTIVEWAIVPNYFYQKQTKSLLTRLFTFTCNRLREVKQARGKAQIVELEKKWIDLIDDVLCDKFSELERIHPKPIKLSINPEKVQVLKEETTEIRDLLYFDEGEHPEKKVELKKEQINSIKVSIPQKIDTASTSNADSEDDEWKLFWSLLDDTEKKAVLSLSKKEESKNLIKLAKRKQITPDLLLDQINEKALESIEDLIVISAGEDSCLNEDYEEELLNFLKECNG